MASFTSFSNYNDVFLSFRCDDPHASSFNSHLHAALQNAQINVFRADDKLQKRGHQKIPTSIFEAIEKSRISIIVLSKGYAYSSWCLEELKKILKCRRNMGQLVLPVFYGGVKPHQVQEHQNDPAFIEAFQFHRRRMQESEEDKVLRWSTALRGVGRLSGYQIDSRNESEEVDRMVDDVIRLLVPLHPVAVKSRMQKVIQVLKNKKSEDVLLIGICGMAGIGKTSIAKAIYNKLVRNFDRKIFLLNIREIWEQTNGRVLLKDRINRSIYGQREMKSSEAGKYRVLIVLDDVNRKDQLKTLFTSSQGFGSGSIIIITTRDVHLLKDHSIDHDNIFRMEEMNESESIELFSWHAFNQERPKEDFAPLTRYVVAYCGGLPLALEVLGSELHGREITSWENILDGLKSHQHPFIQNRLKSSFDGLHDKNEEDIFLEIASNFIGMDCNDVIDTLDGYGLCAATGISNLVGQSFVTIDPNNKLGMHVLLQELGKEITRERSQKKPAAPGIYDVFLSFRGKDTRNSFTSHLYTSLENAGIFVFMDNEDLHKGENISTSLLKAIEGSTIAIIIFSNNYADSKWCLAELKKIIELHKTTGLVVLPVFHRVGPGDVRNQTGVFGEGFQKLQEKHEVSSWTRALREAGRLSGIVVDDSSNESEVIEDVVEHVTRLLDKTKLFVTTYPVGVESRVEDVVQELDRQHSKDDVMLLAIWGMGGLGKTTIAKAIYNKTVHDFEGTSVLLNIREACMHENDVVLLQQRILSDIYKTTKIKIDNIESGKTELKKRLSRKRVLIVLDDVVDMKQLDALCASSDWFGQGSRIIITTRNENLPKRSRIYHVVYPLYVMNEDESLELFSWYAFRKKSPENDFAQLSRDVAFYCGGLPLALEVLGSHLYDRDITEWKSVLEQLKIIPMDEVQKKLKISFDGLSDDPHDTKKEIFLDIACFFIGKDRNDVIQILNDCGLFADIGISVLVERSLVTIDSKNKLRMHDLLRGMGREIIRGESPKKPQERSRLWLQREVIRVLQDNSGTEAVEGLTLQLPRDEEVSVQTKAFEKMSDLRLLQLSGVKLDGDFANLSRNLRWINWHEFPKMHTPTNLCQGNLVAIELEYSKLKRWKEIQLLEKLKILNLSHSHELIETPDFSGMPNLEKLVFKDCRNLSEISHTIENLHKLLVINLKNCTNLGNLPRSIYKLKGVKTLIISGCKKIDKLEEDLEQMESLTTLMANETAIAKVPYSIVRSNIGYVSLCGFEGFSRDVFQSIYWSWSSPSYTLPSVVQTYDGKPFLLSIHMPDSRSHDLSSIFEVLQLIRIEGNLVAKPISSYVSNIKTCVLIDHRRSQGQSFESKNSMRSILIQVGMNCQATDILRDLQKVTTIKPGDWSLRVDTNLDWGTFNVESLSINFEVPQVKGRDLKAIMLHIVYSSSPDPMIASEGIKNVSIKNHTKDELTSSEEEEWQNVISNLEPDDKVEVCVDFGILNVKKIAVYLIYDEKLEHSLAPDENITDSVSDGNCQSPYDQSSLTLKQPRRPDQNDAEDPLQKIRKTAASVDPTRVHLNPMILMVVVTVIVAALAIFFGNFTNGSATAIAAKKPVSVLPPPEPSSFHSSQQHSIKDSSEKNQMEDYHAPNKNVIASARDGNVGEEDDEQPYTEISKTAANASSTRVKTADERPPRPFTDPKDRKKPISVSPLPKPTSFQSPQQLSVEDSLEKDRTMFESEPNDHAPPESLELLAFKEIPPSPPSHNGPSIHELTVRREESERDLVKKEDPLNFNEFELMGSDEETDPLAELEGLLLGTLDPSAKSIKPSFTFIPNDSAITEVLYNLQHLLRNSLKSLLNDEDLYQQLDRVLDLLEDAKGKLPKNVVELVASIRASRPKLVDHFNSLQEIVSEQLRRLERKEVLIGLMSEAKKRQDQLNDEIAEGKKKIDEIDKQIQELVGKREILKLEVEKCEGEKKKKLKEEVKEWVIEGKGLLRTIETNEANYQNALAEEAKIEAQWEGFQKKLVDCGMSF